MGKSEKISRAKKDKINVLRKKYDDFLEDDRKRKDRNVYILERLEKMRTCVANLQINQKGIMLRNKLPTENQVCISNPPTSNNNQIIMRRDIMNYRENTWDDNSILKEISKKYILIPKIHTLTTSSVQNQVTDLESNESDWKTKYNILEQLKKNEKEEPPERDVPISPNVKQDSHVLYEHDICSVNKNINESSITSKTPSLVTTDQRKLSNTYDNEKPQYHISIRNTESDIDVTKEQHIVKTTTTNSSINNDKWNTHSKTNEKEIENALKDYKDVENIAELKQETDTKQDVYASNGQNDICETTEEKSQFNKENIVENITSNEVKFENNVTNDDSIINNVFTESKQIKEIEEIKTDFVPISDNSQEYIEQVNEIESNQDETIYSEHTMQVTEDNQEYQEPETYDTDNNYTNDQYNYYDQSQIPQTHDESYNNVPNENHDTTANYNENIEQQYVNSYENEYNNQYENHALENYDANNYQVENSNFHYQAPEEENTEYVNSENYITSESTLKANLSNNPDNYVSEIYEGEIDSEQEINRHAYFEQSQNEIHQQKMVDDVYVENQVNNINDDMREGDVDMKHEIIGNQHNYGPQIYDENQKQLNIEDSNLKIEDSNINNDVGGDNTTMNHDYQEVQQQHYTEQSNSENQEHLQTEGVYEERQEIMPAN